MIWFGPAGNSESFETMGYKKMEQVPEYLEKMGLNAYEYQCGRGVRLRQDAAAKLKILFAQKNIRVSLHAPYFISLSSVEAEKRDNSIQYILDSAKAVLSSTKVTLSPSFADSTILPSAMMQTTLASFSRVS